MATYSGGILGQINGKVGSAVFRTSLGIQIVQAYQPKVKNPRSDLQMTQRNKISGLGKQAKRFARCVKATKASYEKGQTPYSYFVAENFPNQEATASGTGVFDYENAVISQGDIYPAQDTAVTNAVQGTIAVTWDSQLTQNQEADDVVFTFVIPTDPDVVVALSDDADFVSGSSTVVYGADLEGKEVNVYVCTLSPSTKKASNTVYVGKVTLS